MSLKHAILSMVTDKAKSGYDISKEFSGSVSFYWEASHQQIYKTLAELEAKQWVKVNTIQQTGKPDKKDYCITALGLQALIQWVEQPTKRPPIKNELLVKLLTIEKVGTEVLVKELRRQQNLVQQQLAIFQQIEETISQDTSTCLKSLYCKSKYLALRRGIYFAEGELKWLEECLHSLELNSLA